MIGTAVALLDKDGRLHFQGGCYPCALGRGGRRANKIEGDGATPVGLLPLRRLFYRADRLVRPRGALPVAPLGQDDGWCDDPAHGDYNSLIRLPHPARHEALWRDDASYDVIGVLGWNDAPVIPGRGSAIFLHVARPGLSPTEGCLALELRDLLRVLAEGLNAVYVEG